jgi:phosphoribosyl-AMP cyclohydrolase
MLQPDFAKGSGLLPAIVQEAQSGEVLMLAYMNEEAWSRTLQTGKAHFYSRSRDKIWQKGESSGHVQQVASVRLDCDADTILLLVEQVGGAACHKGYRSCFYRELAADGIQECSQKIFDPREVYS